MHVRTFKQEDIPNVLLKLIKNNAHFYVAELDKHPTVTTTLTTYKAAELGYVADAVRNPTHRKYGYRSVLLGVVE